ncbi:hypothetical protein LTR37_002421 [Vermiconidia calcicola]|uniref:Uncharacterized protein n=1 Tax=Vermiconidia calcicola TaxID=1690605 RepID=A0ACC3NSW8_9PEZI|nr:hypothetical protein LTR37_002421 [Vermiconidia calcicola]
MGIPFSREINAAFEQVTPLVQSAYEVLETTKNIALILMGIQILTVILLSMILLCLIGLLFTLSPELARVLVGVFGIAGFGFLFYIYYMRNVEDATIENQAGGDDENESSKKGKDVEAIKRGESKQ